MMNIFDTHPESCYVGPIKAMEGDSNLDRDSALQAARERFETPIWALVDQLENTLSDLARVRHVDLTDLRAVGSVLNSSLPDAAAHVTLPSHGLEVVYIRDGRSNKIASSLHDGGEERKVSFELHLSGPRGGTSKSAHQFADQDIEREPTFPGFEIEAPTELLFFIACHLSGTGVSVARTFIKFADGIDQRMIELHRALPEMAVGIVEPLPVHGPAGATLKIKRAVGEEKENGSNTDKRGDAASSS